METESKTKTRLLRRMGEAIADFGMIDDGDRVMVCLSGGKDSHTLLDLLLDIQRRAPVNFELLAVNLDQKQPGFPAEVLPAYLSEARRSVPDRRARHLFDSQTTGSGRQNVLFGLFAPASRHSLQHRGRGRLQQDRARPSRRRHHHDSFTEPVLRRLLKAMPPKLRSTDGRNTVIRPLAYCSERDIAQYAAEREFPIIPCDLCGSQSNLKRVRIKNLISELEKEIPHIRASMLNALGNAVPSHLLDHQLFDFKNSEFHNRKHRSRTRSRRGPY
jgi:tRNA 2-thiocytidine biosynthesis protein TtcA